MFSTARGGPHRSVEGCEGNAVRGIGGMLLMLDGTGLRSLGARGVAGSGLILEPDRARDYLWPFSRMAGGMAKDALKAAGI